MSLSLCLVCCINLLMWLCMCLISSSSSVLLLSWLLRQFLLLFRLFLGALQFADESARLAGGLCGGQSLLSAAGRQLLQRGGLLLGLGHVYASPGHRR